MKTEAEHPRVVLDHAIEIFNQVAEETNLKYFQPRSAMTAHLVCMRAAGWESVDYETLMALSGFAETFAYEHRDKYWVGYVPLPGDTDLIAKATGFGWEWIHHETAEEYWQTLKQTLDTGKPVRAPYIEELIFAGYEEARFRRQRRVLVLCVPHAHPGRWWSWKEFKDFFKRDSHGMLGRHTERHIPIPQKEAATQVLKHAVRWATEDPRERQDYAEGARFGFAGMEAYARDIEDISKNRTYFHGGWLGSRNIYPQWTARMCMVDYLRRMADDFPEAMQAHLLEAANQYDAECNEWRNWEAHLGSTAKAPEGAWESEAHRMAGATAVWRAIGHERAAVAEIEKALNEETTP